MSLYILYKVFHKIKKSFRIYILLILQFSIGFFLLNLFLNVSYSGYKSNKEMLKNGLDREYTIQLAFKDETIFQYETFDSLKWGNEKPVPYENTDYPFTSKELSELKQQVGGMVSVEISVSLAYANDENKSYTIYYKNGIKEVQISSEFLEIIPYIHTNKCFNPREFYYEYNEEQQQLYNSILDSYSQVEEIKNKEAIAVLPIEWYYPVFHYKDINHIKLNIKFPDAKRNEIASLYQKIDAVITNWNTQSKSYSFTIGSEFFDFLKSTSTMRKQSIIFNSISCIFLFIILIGLIGLFVLFMERRKKEMAVCLALGATKNNLAWEIFLEILCISFVGFLIGIVTSCIILQNGFYYTYILVNLSYQIPFLLIILLFVIAVLASVPSIYMVKKLLPMEILRSL